MPAEMTIKVLMVQGNPYCSLDFDMGEVTDIAELAKMLAGARISIRRTIADIEDRTGGNGKFNLMVAEAFLRGVSNEPIIERTIIQEKPSNE